MQDENQLTEDSMRQALERFGSGKKKETELKTVTAQENFSQDSSHKVFFKSPSSYDRGRHGTMPRRRRFVEDDTVVVEHQSRSPQKRNFLQRPLHGRDVKPQDNAQELYELKQTLRQEQRKNHEAQEEIKEHQQKVRNLETRIAHYHMQVEELGRQLSAQQAETLRLRKELSQLQEKQRIIQVEQEKSQLEQESSQDFTESEVVVPRRPRGRPPKNRVLLERRQQLEQMASLSHKEDGKGRGMRSLQWWDEE